MLRLRLRMRACMYADLYARIPHGRKYVCLEKVGKNYTHPRCTFFFKHSLRGGRKNLKDQLASSRNVHLKKKEIFMALFS